MNFGFFLILSVTSLVLGDDVCYKYEPMYNNATGAAALSVVRMTSSEICILAGQCKVKEQSSVTNVSDFYAMCPTPHLQPLPQPNVQAGTFYLATVADWKFSVQNQPRNEFCPKKDEVYAAMCYVNDDWSNMCPRDQNNASDWTSESFSNSLAKQPVCYVMKRSKVNRDENGICNVTIAPHKVFCDVTNGRGKAFETAANKSVILFHFDQVGNTCFDHEVSPTKLLAAKQETCRILDQHFTADLPTCPLPIKYFNETKPHFSLHGMFASVFQQCAAR